METPRHQEREFQLLHCTLRAFQTGRGRGQETHQQLGSHSATQKSFCSRAWASSTGWVKKTLGAFTVAQNAAVLAAAPFPARSPQHYRKLAKPHHCHCFYLEMKNTHSCLSTALAKAKGPQESLCYSRSVCMHIALGSFFPLHSQTSMGLNIIL